MKFDILQIDSKDSKNILINNLLIEWIETYMANYYLESTSDSPVFEIEQLKREMVNKFSITFDLVIRGIIKKGIIKSENKDKT